MNMQRMCRLCFLKLQNPNNIFTTPGLLGKIRKLTDIRIQQGDGLPTSICDICNVKVLVADKFRHDVRRAELRIRSLMFEQPVSNAMRRSMLSRLSQPNVYKWCDENAPDVLQSKPYYTSEIFRPARSRSFSFEKVHVEERRLQPTQIINFTSTKTCREPSNKIQNFSNARSLIYSNVTGRALAGCYKILIDYCLAENVQEDFSLPSSFADMENDSDSNLRIETVDNTDNNHSIGNAIDKSLKSITRTVINYDYKPNKSSESTNYSSDRSPSVDRFARVQTDPLNLLKIKIIQPLGEREVERVPRKRYPTNFYPPARSAQLVPGRRPSTPMPARNQRDNFCRTPKPEEPDDEAGSLSASSDLSGLSTSHLASMKIPANRIPLGSSTPLPRLNEQPSVFDFNTSVVSKKSTPSISEIASRKSTLCPVCDRVCASVRGIQVHLKRHRSVNCPICKAPTVTKEQFRDHMKLHIFTPESRPSFQCRQCKSIFKTNVGLTSHMRVHLRSMQTVNECPHCAKKYITKLCFKKHVATCNTGFITG